MRKFLYSSRKKHEVNFKTYGQKSNFYKSIYLCKDLSKKLSKRLIKAVCHNKFVLFNNSCEQSVHMFDCVRKKYSQFHFSNRLPLNRGFKVLLLINHYFILQLDFWVRDAKEMIRIQSSPTVYQEREVS